MALERDPLWFKDAIIYQLHVKAFFDSNNDGIGDFPGLTSRLDYLKELGVNTLWLLPFYPSPLRDDGYDIAEYRDVNPAYGTMADFRAFVKAAHARDLRVITELVINHTSDQHPWFQRARQAPPGSAWRDFYVWSDTDQKFPETRIIFSDTEPSNWAWDPVAKAYYWHRFFSHQPDLNFDNPRVLREVISVMRFWLDMGVDGLRLDAVPYLIEREGTNNENLPETHAVIKQIRKALDDRYPDKMLLAEANQWPEDVRAYFGDGDECHMAFHFPLMPRIYMAVAQEDRHPIVDIMTQTPDIPESCQWATFLRNHDELTLEMVSDRERDYMWNFYAADRRARINFGIRRRLAPLMGGDRRKIELLNSLLMSMPGTPILYYGDEIGMGDNIFLGDRNGVRTPMQWSPDRNGGFSVADPAYLYLPAIMDPIYGFQTVNVEAQRRNPNSLLNWTRQLINAARQQKAFGRGTLRFIRPANRKVLAYLREFAGEQVLCVANVSRSPQAVELDLREFAGRIPVELVGHSQFPRVGELPYMLTLPAYGFFWFVLADEASAPNWVEAAPVLVPDLETLVMPQGWRSLVEGGARKALEQRVLPAFLKVQRWFGEKAATDLQLAIDDQIPIASGTLMLLRSEAGGAGHRHLLALEIAWEQGAEDPLTRLQACSLARVRRGARVGVLFEASGEDSFIRALVAGIVEERDEATLAGRLHFAKTGALPDLGALDELEIKRFSGEQSNTSVAVGPAAVLKLLRTPAPGLQPEAEVSRYLTEISPFANTPALFGTIELQYEGQPPITVALLQSRIENQGDGWTVTLDYLDRLVGEVRLLPPQEVASAADRFAYYTELARRLGLRTGELHRAFAAGGDPAFDPEPIGRDERSRMLAAARSMVETALQEVERARSGLTGAASQAAADLLVARKTLLEMPKALLPAKLAAKRSRLHGDYHLGQVLVAKNDFYIIDFEGEPARPLDERRAKVSPVKDVAGMLRSFDYAAHTALNRSLSQVPEERDRIAPWLEAWRLNAEQAFLAGYREGAGDCVTVPGDDAELRRLIDFYLLEKAAYEIVYEARNRPDWLAIPVRGLLALAEKGSG